MPLPDLNLDNRDFEQIISEARRRIPSYTPEWTDLNESDPGIALVQLFGWLSDMIIHRLNRVPEKSYLKFLELLGIALLPAEPAQADLAFTISDGVLPGDGFVVIEEGTKVALASAVEGGPVIFETDENLYAAGAKLKTVQSFDGAQYVLIDEAGRGPGRSFLPFGEGPPRAEAALYLGFDRALPASEKRPVTLAVYVFSEELAKGRKGLRAPDQPESDGGAQPVEADWEFLAKGGQWQPLADVKDGTHNFTTNGKVLFRVPGEMKSEVLGQLLKADEKTPQFWVRRRISAVLGEGYQTPPRLEDVAINVVGATNAVTATDELLGASDGMPNQSFQLAQRPVLPGSLELVIFEKRDAEPEPWKRVDDFAASGRKDRHYTLNAATGTITFGDGIRGMIPPRLPAGDDETTREKDAPNIRALRYRAGGGARGNAGAGTITSLESPLPSVEKVTNPRPSEGGEDEETLEEAKRRGPEAIRSKSRAVTAYDFEVLATQTPGARIKRARALPLHHPELEPARASGGEAVVTAVPMPGVVTVVVVPAGGPGESKPMPTAETLARVGRHLNAHRLITTELYVAAPKYRQVTVEVAVKVLRTASLREVGERLQKSLCAYFHPLTGGQDGTGWEFGGKIAFSETFRLLVQTPGVAEVVSETMFTRLDDMPHPPCTDIVLARDEIVFSTQHFLTLSHAL